MGGAREQLGRQQTVRATNACVSTTVEDEEVVLQVDSGVYYGLDGVGQEIWSLLQEPRTVEELVDEIASRYEVEEERCRGDVTDFVASLVEAELVEYVE